MRKMIAFLALAVSVMLSPQVKADISINFDDVAKWTAGSVGITSYALNHRYEDRGFVFTGGRALRQTTSLQDGFAGALGVHAWRLDESNAVNWTGTYQTVQTGNYILNGFSLAIRRWDGTPSPNFTLAYSLNGGSTFTSVSAITNTTLASSSAFRTFSAVFSTPTIVTAGQFIVRIAGTGTGSTERIMVDNFELSAVPEPGTFARIGILAALVSFHRRRFSFASLFAKRGIPALA